MRFVAWHAKAAVFAMIRPFYSSRLDSSSHHLTNVVFFFAHFVCTSSTLCPRISMTALCETPDLPQVKKDRLYALRIYVLLLWSFLCQKNPEATEGNELSRINRTLEPLGIAKINGETIATASTFKKYLICLHTEEATGSIPVSPTMFSTPVPDPYPSQN
jgi:hypothetical protein